MPWRTGAPYHRGVGTALIYLIVMILVAAVVFLLASVIFGRGEQLAPLPPGSSPTRLPSAEITSSDIQRLRFQLVLRGYKMSEVDWVLRRLGAEIDQLRERVNLLEANPTVNPAVNPTAIPEINPEIYSAEGPRKLQLLDEEVSRHPKDGEPPS
jgi:DivIVA domain-containing protein